MTNNRLIDVHAHLWRRTAAQDAEVLKKAADFYGIEKILISVLDSCRPDREEIREDNAIAAKLVREDPLFGGYVHVSAQHVDALDILRRGIEEQGLCGMKIWVSCLCDDDRWDPLYEYCGQRKLPVLIHAFQKTTGQLEGESTAAQVRRAALAHPNVRFLMAHLGGNCYEGLPYIADLANVWVDFSGSTCRGDDLPYALELVGAERILFGSDMPGSFCSSLGQVLDCRCTQEERDMILYENARQFFGWE